MNRWPRGFAGLFVAQMLGAMNDNLFKNALVVLVLFRGTGRTWLIPLAGGIFILPYVLFSSLAGQLADRLDKSRLIRATKLYEIGLMIAAAIGLALHAEDFLLLVLFGLGIQATFFGPLKYGVLPELLNDTRLAAGNALVEASTFIGILAGTIAGGLLILPRHGTLYAGSAAILVALCGYAATRLMPPLPPAAPTLAVRANIARETWRLIQAARALPTVWLCILALSWFWALGAAFLSQLPLIVHVHGGSGRTVNVLLLVFSVGVGSGSLLAATLARGRISATPAIPAAFLMSLFALDFCWSARTGLNPRTVLDLFATATCGGVYSVPLYTLLQHASPPSARARMVATNNIINAAAMVAMALYLATTTKLPPTVPLVLPAALTAAVGMALLRATKDSK